MLPLKWDATMAPIVSMLQLAGLLCMKTVPSICQDVGARTVEKRVKRTFSGLAVPIWR